MSYIDKAREHCNQKRAERMKITPEKAQSLIVDLEDYETRWTQWESSFIAQMQDLLKNDGVLSDGQCDKLQEIHTRYTNSSGTIVKDKPRYNM